MNKFNGKTVFITGAGSGIGKEIALKFASEGAKLILNDLPAQKDILDVQKDILSQGGECILKLGDISSASEVEKMFGDIDQVDILVNNAGYYREVSTESMSNEEWDHMLKVLLYGTFYCSRAVIKKMKRIGWGRIINIASDLGQIGFEKGSHYSAAKGGIIAFTKSLALELGPHGILVNAVAPGAIITPLVEVLGEQYIENEKNFYPLRRLGKPEEVASVILFLASEQSSFITGQILGVNGGKIMNG